MSDRWIKVHSMDEKPETVFRYILRDRTFSVIYTPKEFSPTHLEATGWVPVPVEIVEFKERSNGGR